MVFARRPNDPLKRLGRFDQSFFVRMVLSFLVFTLAVATLELTIRFSLVLWEFYREDQEEAQLAAERLANDVRAIMLNQGGPVASRTVYPIIQRNMRANGFEIAIEPSAVTRSSIPKMFDMAPRGIEPEWPDGSHNEGRVDVTGDEFCQQCHVDAAVGEVLGTVTVRSYLQTRLETWWQELRLTVTLTLLNVVIHTVILFFLLRALMGPLLSLRSAVAELAKGATGLTTRAEVRSTDEFGELAHDLNAFLDRVNHILADLQETLGKMVSVSDRLRQATGRTHERITGVERALEATVAVGDTRGDGSAARVAEDLGSLERIIDAVSEWVGADQSRREQLDDLRARLHASRAEWERYGNTMANLPRLVHEVHELRYMVAEIGFLEEHLSDVGEAGKRLVGRLVRSSESPTTEPSA